MKKPVWVIPEFKVLFFALFLLPILSYPQGDIAWVFRYGSPEKDEGPAAVFPDTNGNLYLVVAVTPTEEATVGNADIQLVKIDSLGQKVWVRTYSGPGNSEDVPCVSTRDKEGNIYIAGRTWPVGRWMKQDFFLLKYNPNGQLLWVRTFGSENFRDVLYSVSLDDSQNVYAAGVSYLSGSPKIRIVKYKPTGEMVWVREWTATDYEKIWGLDFHIQKNGGIYLALTAEHPRRRDDWVIVKLSPQGQVRWTRIYRETGNKYEEINSSFTDNEGNLYLTGIVVNQNGDFCTMKIDSLGNIVWVRYYNSPDNDRDEACQISTYRGNIYVAGRSVFREWGEDMALCVIKYDSIGNELWVRRYGAYSDTNYEYRSMKVDEEGNVYVVGDAISPDIMVPIYSVIVKYDSLGNLVWAKKIIEADRDHEGVWTEFDNKGNMYAVGITSITNDDIYIIKYRGR